MRKTIEKQLKIGQVDICNIQIDLLPQDEIPQFGPKKILSVC